MTYSYSTDGELFDGEYETPEAAAAAAFIEDDNLNSVEVGEDVKHPAKHYVSAQSIIDEMKCAAEDSAGEAAEDWLDLATPVCNINKLVDVSPTGEGETAEVCDLVQTGEGSQTSAVIGDSEGGETDAPAISDAQRTQIRVTNARGRTLVHHYTVTADSTEYTGRSWNGRGNLMDTYRTRVIGAR